MIETTKSIIISAIACSLLALSAGCTQKTKTSALGNEALTALKRLEARTEVGVSKTAYSSALGEAYFSVKQFLESADAKSMPELGKALTKTVYWYKAADEFWDIKVDRLYLLCDSIDERLCAQYAELLPAKKREYTSVSGMLQRALEEASKELAKASNLNAGR